MGGAIVTLVNSILFLLTAAIDVSAILSWLSAFDVLNHRNRAVNQIASFLDAVTAPLLTPFRRMIPSLGGIDVSPIVVLLLLQFAGNVFNSMSRPWLISTLG